MAQLRDPRKLYIDLSYETSFLGKQARLGTKHGYAPANAYKYTPGKDQAIQDESAILKIINDHMKRHNLTSLDEVVIAGHGTTGFMKIGMKGWLDIREMVRGLPDKSDAPHIRRLVFVGCNTFGNLSPSDVQGWANLSQSKGVEIVGSTSFVATNPVTKFNGGKFVALQPDGTIRHDERANAPRGSTLSNVFIAGMTLFRKAMGYPPSANGWQDHYIGRDINQGHKSLTESHRQELADYLSAALPKAPPLHHLQF